VIPPAVMEVTSHIPKCQRRLFQGHVEVGNGRQLFATLRPEAPNTFKGTPVQLEDWLEAFHIYLALYGQTDDKIMFMVVNQFLSADVKTWVKTLDIESWVRLQKEMIEYYVDPLEEDRAWNSLNKLQQTGSVKDFSEKFLQLIVRWVIMSLRKISSDVIWRVSKTKSAR
jgi:Retrotransposon gag protein